MIKHKLRNLTTYKRFLAFIDENVPSKLAVVVDTGMICNN